MLTEGSDRWSGRENLHTLWMHGYPLGVACKGCGRRGLVELAAIDAHKGNMTTIPALRLRCSACGSRGWLAAIFETAAELEAWRAAVRSAEASASSVPAAATGE